MSVNTAADRLAFSAALDTIAWWVESASGNTCRIQQDIPNYGSVWFEQVGIQPPLRFVVEWLSVPTRRGNAQVWVQSAAWQGATDGTMATQRVIETGQQQLLLEGEDAQTLLNAMSNGRVGMIRTSGLPSTAYVEVQPIGLRSVLRTFRQCQADLRAQAIRTRTEWFGDDVEPIEEPDVVYFGVDEDIIHPSQYPKLARIIRHILASGENTPVLITGHADQRGTTGYNDTLSWLRAQAVADYLVRAGIPSHRLDIQWFGESKPAVPGETAVAYAANRRVRVTIGTTSQP